LKPAVRGILKVWCLEPKPNVFVTDLNSIMEEKIINFLRPYFKENTGLMLIKSDKRTIQGFTIHSVSSPNRRMKVISGLQFISEKELNVKDSEVILPVV
jgi:CRISPR-associated protein Cas2